MRLTGLFPILVFAAGAAAQTQAPTQGNTTDTLQALLSEVRQLRQDIEAMTAASQRVQIALYSLQLQDSAVARASQRLDDARNRRMNAENGHSHLAGEIQQLQAAVSSGSLKGAEASAMEERLNQLKAELDNSAGEVQTWQTAEAEASAQLRAEQAKLGEMQERIEKLDQALAKLGK